MVPLRSEMTLTQLMARAFQRKGRRSAVNNPTQNAEENVRKLKELVSSNPQPEPHQAAKILGHVLNDAFDAAEDLGLDPAGCMALAEAG